MVSGSHSPALSEAPPAPCLEAEELRLRGPDLCVGPPPRVLDLGFGRVEVLLEIAREHPERSHLGVEVSRKRVWKAARRIERAGLERVRLVHATAEYVLERALPERSIAECWVNFPDPWPKKRHHKRRLVRPAVVAEIARVLEPGGVLHVATDHEPYALWIADVLAAAKGLANLHAPAPWSDARPAGRPITAYEGDWLEEGRRIAYFEYERRP